MNSIALYFQEIKRNKHLDTIKSGTHSVPRFVMLFVALLVGQCLKHISLKFSIPYTPLLTVLGVALGIADRLWMDEHGDDNEQAAHE